MQEYAINVNIVPQDVHKRPVYKDNFGEVYTIWLCMGSSVEMGYTLAHDEIILQWSMFVANLRQMGASR
jgi:hypothetical protein